jgi:hypothetical protein
VNLFAHVSHVIHTFVAFFSGCSTAVLHVGFKILDDGYEVSLCLVVVVLDEDGLLFSHHHFVFVKVD